MSEAGRQVALLRGINVGGKNKLPMKELAAMFTEAGCQDVRTYLQSGNVVFQATNTLASRAPSLVTGAISKRFGFDVPILTRTASEISEVVSSHPFLQREPALERPSATQPLHVVFLARRPTANRIAALEPERSPPDRFLVRGREIFLCCPKGLARTRLTNAYFDSKLATTTTVRSWKTVLQLLEWTTGA